MTLALPAHADPIPPDQRLSGFEQMSADTQAMQRDDFANPAMLAAREGEALWSAAPDPGKQSCAGCHGDAGQSMKGVAARYPAFDEAGRRPIDLAGRIQQCRTERQGGGRWARESPPLLAMTAYLGLQSRGMTVAANPDPRLAPFREEGRALFTRRMGQLDLSCASATTSAGAGSSAARPSRRATPTAIRSSGWNGRASARCNGGCATA